MELLRQKVDTAARAVRRAGWLRVVYEAALALFCAFTEVVLCAAYAPTQQSLVVIGLFGLAGMCAALVIVPLRRLRPMTALGLGAALGLVHFGTGFMLIVLAAGAGYRARRAPAILLGFGFVLVMSMIGAVAQTDSGLLFGLLVGVMLFCLSAVAPAAVAAMIAQRRLLVMTMHQRNLELHQERLLVAGQAQARERNRIAAELHDSLGHRLTLMSLYTGGLSQSLVPAGASSTTSTMTATPQVTEALSLLRDTSAQAMGELRQILRILHQDGSVEAGRSLDEVEATVASARATGTPIELVRSGEPRPLNLLAEHAAFRVVQEGLTNALKYAGGASVKVEVRFEDDALFVEVRNRPGRFWEGPSTGQGLLGLAERVRLAGGVLSHGPVDAGGFRLGALLPYESEVPETMLDPGDFPQEIRRSGRRQRNGLIAVVGALGVALVAAVGAYVTAGSPEPLPENVFNSFRAGDDEVRTRELLPTAPLGSRTTDQGASCETYLADLSVQPESGGEVRYEVCFRGGVVDSKRVLQPRGSG
ncbi:histidine kinase [Kineosporia sp. NBRC 101731]|uniref:sensor histidine kinase n=1 Tax=Kineosporia sp. NBRC 101731 TaxID=3032199 RepID=UPI0024A26A5B|nr:histidine kinase [Kineosporia sp. NBRC 101731]GLY29911.1 two-component sensor histidine kinase [Kineosporia sp. NBRC 101731]